MSLFQLSWVNRFGVLNSGSLWNIKVTKPSKTFPNHRNHVFETSDSSAVGGHRPGDPLRLGGWFLGQMSWQNRWYPETLALAWSTARGPPDPFQMHAVSCWFYAKSLKNLKTKHWKCNENAVWMRWKQNPETWLVFPDCSLWLKWAYHPYFLNWRDSTKTSRKMRGNLANYIHSLHTNSKTSVHLMGTQLKGTKWALTSCK